MKESYEAKGTNLLCKECEVEEFSLETFSEEIEEVLLGAIELGLFETCKVESWLEWDEDSKGVSYEWEERDVSVWTWT